jgi:DNA-binding protein HU-beta
MKKAELVAALAEKTELSKADVERVLDHLASVVTETLKASDEIKLSGLGTFKSAKRAARKGKNPQTGAVVEIPAKVVPVFKPGKELKDALLVSKEV